MRTQSASDRIFMTASMEEKPVFNLHAYEAFGEANNRHYSALFSTTKRSTRFGFDDYQDVLTASFDNRLKIAEGSLVADSDSILMRCILSPQTESRPYNEEDIKKDGYFALRANLLEDANKNIWKIVGEGDSRQIVRLTPEDYGTLLNARRRHMPVVASDTPTETHVEPHPNDYVYYFNPDLLACDFGIYGRNGKTGYVVSRKYKKLFKVCEAQIIEAVAPQKDLAVSMRKTLTALAAENAPLQKYLDYIAMLYGKNSDYYKANEQAIRDLQSRLA